MKPNTQILTATLTLLLLATTIATATATPTHYGLTLAQKFNFTEETDLDAFLCNLNKVTVTNGYMTVTETDGQYIKTDTVTPEGQAFIQGLNMTAHPYGYYLEIAFIPIENVTWVRMYFEYVDATHTYDLNVGNGDISQGCSLLLRNGGTTVLGGNSTYNFTYARLNYLTANVTATQITVTFDNGVDPILTFTSEDMTFRGDSYQAGLIAEIGTGTAPLLKFDYFAVYNQINFASTVTDILPAIVGIALIGAITGGAVVTKRKN